MVMISNAKCQEFLVDVRPHLFTHIGKTAVFHWANSNDQTNRREWSPKKWWWKSKGIPPKCPKHSGLLGGGFKDFLFSPRKLGKIPILTHIFQRGWNHQLVTLLCPDMSRQWFFFADQKVAPKGEICKVSWTNLPKMAERFSSMHM